MADPNEGANSREIHPFTLVGPGTPNRMVGDFSAYPIPAGEADRIQGPPPKAFRARGSAESSGSSSKEKMVKRAPRNAGRETSASRHERRSAPPIPEKPNQPGFDELL